MARVRATVPAHAGHRPRPPLWGPPPLSLTFLMSTVATRSPSHPLCMSVVGIAQTLKLYGRMKMSAIPSPITRRIHSSKFAGLPWARATRTLASTSPWRHASWSSLSSAEMLFWKGYATQRPLIHT